MAAHLQKARLPLWRAQPIPSLSELAGRLAEAAVTAEIKALTLFLAPLRQRVAAKVAVVALVTEATAVLVVVAQALEALGPRAKASMESG